ncbi:MAG: FAD binding domain-containing protein [Candidatus Rokuibacteriota bacterium]
MYPAAFEYHTPTSVQDALGLLTKLKDDAKLLAGGHSLIPMMKLRLAQPKHLIDLRKVPGLSGIKEESGALAIGAMTTHYQVESSALVKSKIPVLAEVGAIIGDPAVRNLGTVGGSLAHADPAADWPAAMIALGAEFVCEGPKGRRTVKVDDWFQGLMSTAVREDEILVQVRVPTWPAGSGAAYMKFPHPASRFAVVGAAAALTLDSRGACTRAGVGITGAGTKAVRAKGVEAGLTGKVLDTAGIEAAAQKAAEGVDVQADLQGSVEYKSHLCRVFARRAIEAAVKRAKG